MTGMHRGTGNLPLLRRPLRALAGGLLLATLGATATAAEQITLNMRNADINSVLQWLAETTGKRVIVDPRVRGQVTILSRDPMSPAEALQVVVAAINVYGFTAIEQGEVLQVVPAANIKTGTTQQLESLKDPNVDFPVNEMIRLGTLPAEQLATTLRPLMPPNAGLMALPGGNALLVTDTASGVRRIAQLARELDQNATLDLDVVPLTHANAADLLGVLQELLGAKEGAALQLVTDQRVNAIVMAGTPEMRARARDIINRLDQPEVAEGSIQVVYLHYLKASEMLAVLKGMGGGRDDKGKEGAPQAPFAIEASESTNALVISAPRDRMDAMLEVIRKLDIRRAQVLVEAIIAEVSDGVARDLGVEWKTSFDGEGLEGISRFSNGLVQAADNPLGAVGRGLTLGYFRNGSLRALVRALEIDGKTNILSMPSIVTLDNQEAEILVGSNVPFKTGESTSAGAPTTNPFTTIERQDIGVTLKVTPQINQGDAITLDILQTVETLTESEEAEDIITDKRSIHTSVMLEDQDILVLGGLSQDEVIETVQKVPVLGDIPLLGMLFRSTSTSVDKKNLMVFVRTRILTDLATAEQETMDRYNRVRELQQQINEPDGKRVELDSSPQLPPIESSSSSP